MLLFKSRTWGPTRRVLELSTLTENSLILIFGACFSDFLDLILRRLPVAINYRGRDRVMRYLVVLMLAAFMAQAGATTINVSKTRMAKAS